MVHFSFGDNSPVSKLLIAAYPGCQLRSMLEASIIPVTVYCFVSVVTKCSLSVKASSCSREYVESLGSETRYPKSRETTSPTSYFTPDVLIVCSEMTISCVFLGYLP
jgi:hypothetical protein